MGTAKKSPNEETPLVLDCSEVLSTGTSSTDSGNGNVTNKHHDANLLDEFTSHPSRYMALIAFCIFTASNSNQLIGMSNVIREAQSFYDVGAVAINGLAAQCFYVYVPIAPISSLVTESLGLKHCLTIGATLNLVGSIIKMCTGIFFPNYWLLFVGQFLASIAMGFILQIPPVLACTWFPDSERTFACTCCSNAGNFGIAMGLVIPPFIVGHVAESLRDSFIVLFAFQVAVAAIPFILLVFFVDAAPPTPPSPTASMRRERHQDDSVNGEHNGLFAPPTLGDKLRRFWVELKRVLVEVGGDFKTCLSSPANFSVCFAVGLAVGAGWIIAGVLYQLMEPFGVDGKFAGWMGFAIILAGLVAAVPAGKLVDQYKTFKVPLLIGIAMVSFAFTALLVILYFLCNNMLAVKSLATISLILLGIGGAAATPIGLELLAEMTFPLNEFISSTLMMMWANLFAGVMMTVLPVVFLGGPSHTKEQTYGSLLTLIGITSTSLLVIAFVKPKLLRQAHEDAVNQQQAGDSSVVAAAV